ncbi:odorant receptor 9a [Drosophila nasuta]|uniref:odorant receptor 9a n=1 Tax=Drosophila nasuta TaxID=42062 RepID=UPI00295EBB94|nr:odorant receptor 9a [Drosophila nasuta]
MGVALFEVQAVNEQHQGQMCSHAHFNLSINRKATAAKQGSTIDSMDEAYFLRVQVLAFRLMGFDLWNNNSSKDRPQISFLVIGTMGAFLGPLFFAIKFYIKNVSIMSDAMGSFLAILLTLVKYGVFIYYRGDFVQLIYRIRGILEREIVAWPQAAQIVETENRSDQALSLTYMRCFFAACLFAGIKPIVIMVTTKLRTGETYLELPHSGVYPWSDQAILYYAPTYIWNLLASYGAVTMSLAMDTLLFAFTYNVCALFKIAQHRIRHLQPMEQEPRQELQQLIDVLRLHQTGLMIATQLGRSLRPLVFMQFFVTALQLCFLGFQLADLFPSPVCVYFIFFVSSLLIALFIYSHCGENMKQASADFAIAVYDSNWVEFAPATRRALIVTIMRAQRPCQLKGYFFEPNMATFSAVVRSAISYVMMLRSFNATGQA